MCRIIYSHQSGSRHGFEVVGDLGPADLPPVRHPEAGHVLQQRLAVAPRARRVLLPLQQPHLQHAAPPLPDNLARGHTFLGKLLVDAIPVHSFLVYHLDASVTEKCMSWFRGKNTSCEFELFHLFERVSNRTLSESKMSSAAVQVMRPPPPSLRCLVGVTLAGFILLTRCSSRSVQ